MTIRLKFLIRAAITSAIPFILIVANSAARANDEPLFAIKESRRDSNGVTMRTLAGTMRIEICGDRIVHVVASPTSEIPTPKVPVVTQPCRPNHFQVRIGNKKVRLSTAAIVVTVDTATGALTFSSTDGTPVLSEPKEGGKSFDVPSVFEAKKWQVQQTFLSPADEAMYGLGQHQEGIFDLREVPIRLSQANTNISIPFLLSSKGYGILWNNASLTDFNPADQSVAIDPSTGEGKFTTGARGVYGFVMTGNNKDQLVLRIDGQNVIDLENTWTPTSASGFVTLDANKEYEVSAWGGKAIVQLAVRPPAETTTFRSEVGKAVDYYFFYGPHLDGVISDYRRLTGHAQLFPKWAYGYWQCRERYHSQNEILDTATEFRKRQIPVDVLVQDWLYCGQVRLERIEV